MAVLRDDRQVDLSWATALLPKRSLRLIQIPCWRRQDAPWLLWEGPPVQVTRENHTFLHRIVHEIKYGDQRESGDQRKRIQIGELQKGTPLQKVAACGSKKQNTNIVEEKPQKEPQYRYELPPLRAVTKASDRKSNYLDCIPSRKREPGTMAHRFTNYANLTSLLGEKRWKKGHISAHTTIIKDSNLFKRWSKQ